MKIYYNNFKYSDSIVKSIYIYKSVVFKKLRNVIVFSKISNKSDFLTIQDLKCINRAQRGKKIQFCIKYTFHFSIKLSTLGLNSSFLFVINVDKFMKILLTKGWTTKGFIALYALESICEIRICLLTGLYFHNNQQNKFIIITYIRIFMFSCVVYAHVNTSPDSRKGKDVSLV